MLNSINTIVCNV